MHLPDSLRVEMRGDDLHSVGFFSYLRLEHRIPVDHPRRAIRELVDAALKEVVRDFDKLYAGFALTHQLHVYIIVPGGGISLDRTARAALAGAGIGGFTSSPSGVLSIQITR